MRFSIRRSFTAAGAVLALLLAMLVTQVAGAKPARADYGAMIQPVTGVVTGVLTNRCGNYDGDHYGIDINGPGVAGRPVVAAYSGTVTRAAFDSGYGNRVDINHGNDYLSRYAHMTASLQVVAGQWVEKGQLLGYVGNTGASYGAHLHFEVWYGTSDFTRIGPGFGCGQSVTQGQPIGADLPGLSAGGGWSFSLRSDGMLQGKESLLGSVVDIDSNVVSADADGNTFAVVESDGTAWVKRGAITSGWIHLSNNAKEVAVDGDRFVVLHADGAVEAKDGLTSTGWVTLTTGAVDIDADANRVGVINTQGVLSVKEGGLTQPWVVVETQTTDFGLSGSRIGVVAAGTAKVKEGGLTASWVAQAAANQIEISGNRIAIREGGTVHIKDGALNAAWTLLATSSSDVALSGDRIGIVQNGVGRLKSGGITSAWVDAYSNSTRIYLN